MLSALDYITHCTEDCLVLSDCDIICNIDLSEVIAAHAASGADITFVTKRVDASRMYLAEQVACITADSDGRVTEFAMRQPTEELWICIPTSWLCAGSTFCRCWRMPPRGYTSFFHDVLIRNERDPGVHYRVYSYEGWYAYISSLENYYACSMKLPTQEARDGLFGVRNRPVLTKVRNSPPTRYSAGSDVTNSVIADGCVIEGKVENCILFRGVRIGRGAVIRNSILMQNTYVGSDVRLDCVITDKDVVIRDSAASLGCEKLPYFIGKGGRL